jgi:flagellar assembly factor FliW
METNTTEASAQEIAQKTDLQIETHHFGPVTVSFDQFLYFPEGIIGFEALKRYALLEPYGKESMFRWLQSMDRSDVAFLVANPGCFLPDYKAVLDEEAGRKLEAKSAAVLQTFAIVTVPKEEPPQIWVNLQAPLVANTSNKLASQVILTQGNYSMRHKVYLKELTHASVKSAA